MENKLPHYPRIDTGDTNAAGGIHVDRRDGACGTLDSGLNLSARFQVCGINPVSLHVQNRCSEL